MSLTQADLLALIDARAASDPEFAALVAARNDTAIAAALSVGRIKAEIGRRQYSSEYRA